MIEAGEIRTREEQGRRFIYGYWSKFNSPSLDLGGFRETLKPGCFDHALLDADVRYLVNHNRDIVLGRNKSGTLRIYGDSVGMLFEVEPPDTSIGDHYYKSVSRGDISGGSFRFYMFDDPNRGQKWEDQGDGTFLRTITEVAAIDDITLATYPAYPDTESAVRCLELAKVSSAKPTFSRLALARKRLRLLEI